MVDPLSVVGGSVVAQFSFGAWLRTPCRSELSRLLNSLWAVRRPLRGATLALLLLPGAGAQPRPAVVLLAPVIVLVNKAFGLYDRDQYRLSKTTINEAPSLLQLAMIYGFAVWLAEGLLIQGHLSRGQAFMLVLASFGLTMICRAVTRWLVLRLTSPERCLVVGCSADAERTRLKLASSSGVNAVIVGHVCIGEKERRGVPPIGDSDELSALIKLHEIERVIVAPDGHDQDEILDCIRHVKALGVKVSVVPRLLEVVGSSSVFDDLHGMTLLGVRQYGLSKSFEILKRMVDIVGAGLGMIVLAPLFLLLAAAIRLESKGSPFFLQPRIGRRGRALLDDQVSAPLFGTRTP